MAVQRGVRDWSVTDEKIAEAARRIVGIADPSRVILFGSRAREDHRPDSGVDLAVIVDGPGRVSGTVAVFRWITSLPAQPTEKGIR